MVQYICSVTCKTHCSESLLISCKYHCRGKRQYNDKMSFLCSFLRQKLKSVLSLAICMLECMLMGGAIFGWGPILYTFEQDDIYSEQCTNKNVTTVTLASKLYFLGKYVTRNTQTEHECVGVSGRSFCIGCSRATRQSWRRTAQNDRARSIWPSLWESR